MGKRVLVIDPSRTIQIVLSTNFRHVGHQVLTCSSSQEALEVLARLEAAPDTVFLATDDAQEAYKVIAYVKTQRAYSQTRRVVMLHQEEKAVLERMWQEARVHYLIKPFQIQDALVCQRRSISEPVQGRFDQWLGKFSTLLKRYQGRYRLPLTPLEKRAQRIDAPLKRKKWSFLSPFGKQPFRP